MVESKTILIAHEENITIRVLVKKLNDAGVQCEFVPWRIDTLSGKLEEIELLTIYLDDGNHPKEKVLHYLNNKLSDEGKKLILIGDMNDLKHLYDHVPGDLIFKTFERPVNNEEFVSAVKDYFKKVDDGVFRKSILVVDDDPNYLNLVRDWLKGHYKVTMANSGLQAIKYLGKNKVDLILLDHEMPVTSGPKVLEMLRSDDETKDIPVMFLTGKSDKESVMEVVALKPEGYFLKTIEKQDLLNNLEKFFKKDK